MVPHEPIKVPNMHSELDKSEEQPKGLVLPKVKESWTDTSARDALVTS